METYQYNCNYCQKEYIPTRRGVQKYCSNSCRSRGHQIKKQQQTEIVPKEDIETLDAIPIENTQAVTEKQNNTITMVGFKESTAGTLAGNTLYDVGKALLTPDHKKPATKEDIANLEKRLKTKRYYKVKNMNPDSNGALPYFDIINQVIVYSFLPYNS